MVIFLNLYLKLILQSLSLMVSNPIKFFLIFVLTTKPVHNCAVTFLGPLENRLSVPVTCGLKRGSPAVRLLGLRVRITPGGLDVSLL
jgi:hypothetical protein